MDKIFQLNMNRPITCAFTGHRPQKMPSIFDEKGGLRTELVNQLEDEIESAISIGYKFFMCGGGLGFDMTAAQCVLGLKSKYPFIKLKLALPCLGHYARWHPSQKSQFLSLLEKADDTIYVSDSPYFEGCMSIRNKYMVDHSSLIICAYNGVSGGTKNTITYAEKSYVTIVILKTTTPPCGL